MAKGAKLFEVVYVDNQERTPVLVGIGDTIRATDWAEKEYPFPPKPDLHEGLSLAEIEFNREDYREAKFAVNATREHRAGLYAVYLGAARGKLRGTELGWQEWLDVVTMPDDDDEAEAPAEGESQGPSSEA